MATLFFCVYPYAGATALGDVIQEATVSIGGASVQSAAVNGTGRERRKVRLFADADCFVTWGADPTALSDGTAGRPMRAEDYEYVDIEAGHLLAVIERV